MFSIGWASSPQIDIFMSLKKSADTIMVEFNGGEVTLNFALLEQAIPKIIALAESKNKKVQFNMQTNGTFMTDEMAEFLKKYNVSVGISLDGTQKYNKNRIFKNGEETFDLVINTINTLKRHQVHYSTLSVICQRGQFEDTVKLLQYTGCREYRANLKRSLGRGVVGEDDATLKELAQEYIEYCKNMLCDRKYYEGNLLYYFMSLYLYTPFMCYKEPCGSGRNQLYITAQGDIYACQQSCYIKKGRLGTVDIPVEELQCAIEENDWIQALQTRKKSQIQGCKECPWKKFCYSCLCKEMEAKNTVFAKNSFCEFNQYVLHELMWIAGENPEIVMNYLQYNF